MFSKFINPAQAVMLCILPSLLAQEKIVLRVANWATAEEFKLEEEIAAEFMRQHPNVTVQVESIPARYKEKILTYIAAGQPPDVILLDISIIPALLNKGVLLDLNPRLSSLAENLDDYFPNVLNIFMQGESLYALPKDFTPMVMYYNKKLFDEADVQYPNNDWRWEDYLQIAQQLTKDTNGDGIVDQYGTAFLNRLYRWQPWVWISGGDILSPDGSTAVGYLNSPETERALQFLIDLRTKHYVAPHRDVMSEQRTNPGITWGMFYSGRIAMLVSGHWELLKLKQYMERGEMDVGVVPMPSPNDGQRVTVIYAAGWSVPKGTRHPDWAVKLAAFLAGEKAAQIRARSGIAVPARKKIAQELAAADPFGLEKIFVEEIPYGREPWGAKIDEFSRVEDLVEDAVDDVLIGSRDIHEVFTQAAYRIDDELKNLAIPRKDAVALKGNPEILRFLLLVLGVALVAATAGTLLTRRGDRASILKGYSFIAPSFVILIVFVFAPVFFSLYLSFHQWNVVSSDKPFVGFENIQSLLAERDFWNAMKNTVVYSLHVPLGMAVSLAVAMMMNQKMRGVNLLRTLFFLPSVSSFVAIALVWQWMYHPQFGLANYLLGFFGIPPFSWLSEPSTALASIMLMSIWMGIGYQMVIFLAGLQGISHELYEAAITDGANVWQRFWKITLPLLKPTTFFILVTSMIGSFQVFAFVYVMTEGGPLHSTDVVVYHIYKNAWEYLKMGYASAMSWVLFLIIMVATWVQFRLIGKRVEYG